MSYVTSQKGNEPEHAPVPSSSSLYLIDCIHPSCYLIAAAAKVERGLQVLHRILHNVQQHPAERRFRRFSTNSAAWQQSVVPVCYVMRTTEWLGFAAESNIGCTSGREESEEGHMCFVSRDIGSSSSDATLGSSSLHFVSTRLAELRAVRAAWLPAFSNCNATSSASKISSSSLTSLREWLTNTYTSYMNDETRWTALKRQMRLHLVRQRLREEDESDVAVRAQLTLVMDTEVTVTLPHALLQGVSITELEDCLREAELSHTVRTPSVNHPTITTSDVQQVNVLRQARTTVSAEVRRRIAARHRAALADASVQAQCAETSEAYRALSAEEKLVGTALIADIAAFMEQVALVKGEQGLVRHDRLAARDLLRRFKHDADLGALHALRDLWEDRLEEAKKEMGKTLVYYHDD